MREDPAMTGKQFFLLAVSLQLFAAFAFAVARREWPDASGAMPS